MDGGDAGIAGGRGVLWRRRLGVRVAGRGLEVISDIEVLDTYELRIHFDGDAASLTRGLSVVGFEVYQNGIAGFRGVGVAG